MREGEMGEREMRKGWRERQTVRGRETEQLRKGREIE